MNDETTLSNPLSWHAYDRGVGWEVHTTPKPADHDHPPWCTSVNDGYRETMTEQDARYIAKSANAYPRLVALLGEIADENVWTVSPECRREVQLLLAELRED